MKSTTGEKSKKGMVESAKPPKTKEAGVVYKVRFEDSSVLKSSLVDVEWQRCKRKRGHEDGGKREEGVQSQPTQGSEPERKDKDEKKKKKKVKKKKKEEKKKTEKKGPDHEPEPEPEPEQDGDRNASPDGKYPYDVDDDDHCESPLESYAHIVPLLVTLGERLHKSPAELRIYDPYYCTGAVKSNLHLLGYTNVYNVKEDFYAVLAAGRTPPYDCVVTNPPYSDDHMDRLTAFIGSVSNTTPWFLLMPNFVYTKPYWASFVRTCSPPPSYVAPLKRYLYTTPYGRRQQKSSKVTSPFPTFWYCGNLLFLTPQRPGTGPRPGPGPGPGPSTGTGYHDGAVLCRTGHDLPLDVLPENDPRKKREKNALKRKKNKARKKAA